MSVEVTYGITCTSPDDLYLDDEDRRDQGTVLWHIQMGLDGHAEISHAPGLPGVHVDVAGARAILAAITTRPVPDDLTARQLDRADIDLEYLTLWVTRDIPEVGQRRGLYERLRLAHSPGYPGDQRPVGALRVTRYGVQSLRVGLAACIEFLESLAANPGGRKPEKQAMDILGNVVEIQASVSWTE